MKKIKIFNLLTLFIILISLISCKMENSDTLSDSNSLNQEENTFTYEGYYESLNGNLDNNLRDRLTSLLESTHTTKITYDQAWSVLEEADEALSDNTKIECFYTNKLIDKNKQTTSIQSGTWNREHVWPKSYGFNAEKYDAYSDCHHLHATSYEINSIRGNKYFDNVSSSSTSYYNNYNDNAFEVRDDKKGDVARSIFYMYARYNSETLRLELTDDLTLVTTNQDKVGYFGKLKTLIEWHFYDPVDSKEVKRNEVVKNYQGNYNPFIDHPELVYYLFKAESEELGINLDNLYDVVNNTEVIVPEENEEEKTDDLNKYSFENNNLNQAYTKDINLNINNLDFYFSIAYGNGDTLRLGYNSKNATTIDDKFKLDNVSGSNGAYLSFNSSITSFKLEYAKTYSGLDGVYLLYSSDSNNFELIYDFTSSISSDGGILETTFDLKEGLFVFLITGSQARIDISSITLN